MSKKITNYNWKYIGIMVLASYFYMLPFFTIDEINHFSSQDTQFHLARIMGLGNVWESPVNFLTFHHNGSMLNVFYPYLTVYPAFLLIKATGSVVFGYKLYLLGITVATMLIAYYSMNTIKKNENTALFFALIYTFATYRTTDIYYRQSLGEGVAMTFFPLVLAGMYQIFFGDQRKWKLLMVGMTLLMYTHLLSVAMFSLVIGTFLLGSFLLWDKKKERIRSLLYATGGTFGLSLGFLIPFMYRTATNNLNTPTGVNLEGIPVKLFLNFALKNAPNGYTIGLILLLGTIFSIIKLKKMNYFDRALLILGIFLVIMTTSLFEWGKLNSTPVITIQFVWRLNGFATLFLSYAFSVAFTGKKDQSNHVKLYALIGAIAIAHSLAMFNLYGTDNIYNYIAQKNDEIHKIEESSVKELKTSFFSADYTNKKAMDNLDVPLNYKFLVDGKDVNAHYSYSANKFKVEIETDRKSGELIMPIIYYNDQTIMVNGKKADGKESQYGMTEVRIKKGKSIVEISYKYKFIEKIAVVISVVMFVVFILWEIEPVKTIMIDQKGKLVGKLTTR